MPYGMPKKVGGDTPSIDSRMARCVQDVMAKGKDKVSAIRICKVAITKSLAKRKRT